MKSILLVMTMVLCMSACATDDLSQISSEICSENCNQYQGEAYFTCIQQECGPPGGGWGGGTGGDAGGGWTYACGQWECWYFGDYAWHRECCYYNGAGAQQYCEDETDYGRGYCN